MDAVSKALIVWLYASVIGGAVWFSAVAEPRRNSVDECLDMARSGPPPNLNMYTAMQWNGAAGFCAELGVSVPRTK